MIDTKRREAIEKSIAHWEEDILKPLLIGMTPVRKGGTLIWAEVEREVPCYAAHCPLCDQYADPTVAGCPACPYQARYGCACYREGETWQEFSHEPCVDNAQAMISKLKDLL